MTERVTLVARQVRALARALNELNVPDDANVHAECRSDGLVESFVSVGGTVVADVALPPDSLAAMTKLYPLR